VFKRRNPKTYLRHVADVFYPQGGWSRAVYYVMHRLRRLPDPPHRIARGVAAGVFVCFTPLFGMHFVAAWLLALVMQGNIWAALLATFFGNPFTFPVIAAVSLETGQWLLGMEHGVHVAGLFGAFQQASFEIWANLRAIFTPETMHWDRLGVFYAHVFKPYLVGGIIPGIITAVAAYLVTRPAVSTYQKARIKRLKARYQKRRRVSVTKG